jgi:hypothetical protein
MVAAFIEHSIGGSGAEGARNPWTIAAVASFREPGHVGPEPWLAQLAGRGRGALSDPTKEFLRLGLTISSNEQRRPAD